MKTKVILWSVTVLMAAILFVSCGNGASSSPDGISTDFSLNSLYKEDTSKLRFNVKKKEVPSGYEKVSEQWQVDFIILAEMRQIGRAHV